VTLELRNVVKRVGAQTHIHETSVCLANEGFNILLGTTLAGKTTLMELMAGLNRPTAGEIWFDGRNVTAVPVRKRNVSMVYQQFINYPNLSVYDNIASPLRIARMKRAHIKERVHRMAELLRLTPMLGRRPIELSGGQQQRTALARALVKDADLVLLDEPLANLDFKLREELRDELPRLFAGRRCTVVFATSDPTEALLLGGHIATLHEGRVTQFGPTRDVYRKPANLRTAQVFSDPALNTAPVIKQGTRLVLSDSVHWQSSSAVRALPDGPYTLGVRPHHVSPVPIAAGGVALQGRVRITELSGSESVIHFDHGPLAWMSQSHGVHDLGVGLTSTFHLDVARCMYFGADGSLVATGGAA
jgi:glycerol transport system ATP-binding protein